MEFLSLEKIPKIIITTPRVTPSATTRVWSCPRAGDTGRPHTGMSSSWVPGTLLELFVTMQGHQELLKQLSLLPRDNYNLLSYICRSVPFTGQGQPSFGAGDRNGTPGMPPPGRASLG